MIKRYYIEETDGKETKRTLTTFNEIDDMRNYSDEELQEMYYEATAELVSKAHKVELLYEEFLVRSQRGEGDFDFGIIGQADENCVIAMRKIM